MRIAQLTAGTGSFYCGTCLRDNALVIALRRLGHEAVLVPMYLPMAVDETDASQGMPVFYGGVNAYLQQKSVLFRKTPRWFDRALDSPRALAIAAKRAGATRPEALGDLTHNLLLGEEGRQKKELDRLGAWLSCDLRPDAILLSNALLMGLAPVLKAATGAIVACTLQGEDTFLDALAEPHRSRSWEALGRASKSVDAFIAVSRYYAGVMTSRLPLPPERVHVVHNGILLDGYQPAESPPPEPTVGFLARICPPKGLHDLVTAFLALSERGRVPNARLWIGGSMTTADRPYAEKQLARLRAAGLGERIRFAPNLSREEKIEFLEGLSLLCVPATYGESFGLYVIEGLAAGVPFLQPNHAAFPELLDETGGGRLYDPCAEGALALAMEEMLLDREGTRTLGEKGAVAVRERFGVERMAEGALRAIMLPHPRIVKG